MKLTHRTITLTAALSLVPLAGAASGPRTVSPPPHPAYERRGEHDPNGTGLFYMGREIAQVMGHEISHAVLSHSREKYSASK